MTVYWLSFRISEQRSSKGTYDQRRDALIEAVRQTCSEWWLETTSYVAFRSDVAIDSLGAKFKAAIDPERDLFLMRAMDKQSAVICGHSEDADIYTLMPYLTPI